VLAAALGACAYTVQERCNIVPLHPVNAMLGIERLYSRLCLRREFALSADHKANPHRPLNKR
jgi:hypothetical protein